MKSNLAPSPATGSSPAPTATATPTAQSVNKVSCICLSLSPSLTLSLSHAVQLWVISAQIMAYNNSYTNSNNNNSNSNKRSTKWTRQSKQLTWRRHIKIPLCQTPLNLRVWLGVELDWDCPSKAAGGKVAAGFGWFKLGAHCGAKFFFEMCVNHVMARCIRLVLWYPILIENGL